MDAGREGLLLPLDPQGLNAQLSSLTVHHIPVCPFSQRLEILLALKGTRDEVTSKWSTSRGRATNGCSRKTPAPRRCRSWRPRAARHQGKPGHPALSRNPAARAPGRCSVTRYRHAVESMLVAHGRRIHRHGLPLRDEPTATSARVSRADAGPIRAAERLSRRSTARGAVPLRGVRWAESRVHADVHAVLVPRLLRGFRASGDERPMRASRPGAKRASRTGRAAGDARADRQALLRLRQGRRKRRPAARPQHGRPSCSSRIGRSRPWPPRDKYGSARRMPSWGCRASFGTR